MKKIFILFVSLALILGLMPIANSNTSLAATDVTPTIFNTTFLGTPMDLSFEDENFWVLSIGANPNSRYITAYSSNDIGDSSGDEITNFESVPASYLTSFNNSYFYATTTKVFRDNIEIQEFTKIIDITVSYKNLFLINSIDTNLTHIYKYEADTGKFNFYKEYAKEITKFCYNEVSKTNFAYDGQYLYINNSPGILINNAADIVCDFEGNLYVFQNNGNISKVDKYTYNSDYSHTQTFTVNYGLTFSIEILSAVIVQENGNAVILIGYDDGSSVISYRIAVVQNSVSKFNIITANTVPDVDFSEVNIFDLNLNINSVAKITGYPSSRLYTVDPLNNNKVIVDEKLKAVASEEERYIGQNVLVFKKSEKFALVLYYDSVDQKYIPAIIYNNSLVTAPKLPLDFENGKIMLDNTAVYKHPSNFNTKPESSFFKIDKLNKNTEVKVLYKIEMTDAIFAYIEYGNGLRGYVNAVEILDASLNFKLENPIYGFVDCNGKVSLFEKADLNSAVVAELYNGQKFKILSSGTDFYHIEVEIDGKSNVGFIQSKYVLESGLTNMEKLGLYIGLSVVALVTIALIIRFAIKSRRKKLS